MTASTLPFAVPEKLPVDLARVRDYWDSLRRRESSMPFWDDLNPSSLLNLSDRLMIVDTFEMPQRYRFNTVGEKIRGQYGADLIGKFVDEIDATSPLEYLTAQASATIESKAPTFFNRETAASGGQSCGYARLLLPMWGNGRIEMLLGVIANHPA